MKQTILIFTTMILALAACTPAAQPADYIPDPSDSELIRADAYLDSPELLTLESFPPQFTLILKGKLPTPCHKLRIAVSPPNSNNEIEVDVYSVIDPNAVCAEVLEPFEVNYPLGSFPTGHYVLIINGGQAAEFDS